ncbi:unnamed protein product [Gongylonema pulchrum]|uniref:UPF0020 domain-containing protein n=1 Tax=Gongylonema pulchrum TaxID=637853 RepID=A0A183DNJ9_9BILA|nr:unnamed protein product [Gongylonema pulchrum]
MEPFVREQLTRIPNSTIEKILEGKILFEVNCFVEPNTLRCMERLFLVIAYEDIDCSLNKRQLFDKLFGFFRADSLMTACEEAFAFLILDQQSESKAFRVSLKTTGKWRRRIYSDKLSASIAQYIKRATGLRSSLHNATLEICIHVTEKYIFVGIPLTRKPLSLRSYLSDNALRSTIADAMLQLTDIQVGDVVLDLTCGSSSILLQAAHDFPDKVKRIFFFFLFLFPRQFDDVVKNFISSLKSIGSRSKTVWRSNQAFLLGADYCWNALQLSLSNRDHLRKADSLEPLMDLLCMDLFNECFKFKAIDHIVSDLPFGQQHGTNESALRILQHICDIFSK